MQKQNYLDRQISTTIRKKSRTVGQMVINNQPKDIFDGI